MGTHDDNNNTEDDGLNEYERDKIQKQSLVLSTLTSAITTSSPHTDIQTIATALESGKYKLSIENLSGGYTNYTYKVFLTSTTSDNDRDDDTTVPSTALFVKLCFPRAFWNPDPDYVYEVQRIANEYEMMEKFEKLAPGCVATPYLLLDIGDMKLLATQWSTSDEQMANQFIDGVGDIRIAKKLAVAIAALHCKCDIDPEFNSEARECMIDIFPNLQEVLAKMAKGETTESNRATKLAQEIGPDACSFLFAAATKSYRDKIIPCHADLHMFNILVESKPQLDLFSEENDDVFGKTGSFCICDWEMVMSGPLGLDMGRLYSIPVACILAHSISGNSGVSEEIIEWLDSYWNEYSTAMIELGKDEEFLCKSYQNAMAWLGWKLYAMSVHEWFIGFLPECDIDTFKESLGVVGITLMCLGFGGGSEEGLAADELVSVLVSCLMKTIADEVSVIESNRRGRPSLRRKSSILRQTNRRVSDAFVGISRASLAKAAADITLGDTV